MNRPDAKKPDQRKTSPAKNSTPGKKRRKEGSLWGWIPILLIIFMGLGGTYLLLFGGEDKMGGAIPEGSRDASYAPELHPVMLFYGALNDPSLVAESHWIDVHRTPEARIKDLIEALIGGSQQGFVSSIPPETTLLGVFLDGLGGAYLNFSSSLRTLHPRGDGMEWLTVRSIVGTVTQNVPEVERVWILIDGGQDKPLVQSIPLDRYYSWSDINS